MASLAIEIHQSRSLLVRECRGELEQLAHASPLAEERDRCFVTAPSRNGAPAAQSRDIFASGCLSPCDRTYISSQALRIQP